MGHKKNKKRIVEEQKVKEAVLDALHEDVDAPEEVDAPKGQETSETEAPMVVALNSDDSESLDFDDQYSEFENNSLEDPELTVSAFDRGGRTGRGRSYDPRLKPQGMPRHKEKKWRDLPLGGKIYEILYYVCLVVFCVSLGVLAGRGYIYMTHRQQMDAIKDLYADFERPPISTRVPAPTYTDAPTAVPTPTPNEDKTEDLVGDLTGDLTQDVTLDAQPTPFIPTPPPVSTPVPQPRPSFASLLSVNRDVVGWIQLTGTVINYPVLQSKDENNKSFYIDHDIYGKANYYGSIFMDYACSSDNLGRNTIISGHHMQDGEMFRQIANYTSAYMWKQNPIIYFDSLYENYEWEIFACFLVDAAEETIPYSFATSQEFIEFCNACKDRSVVKLAQNVEFGPNDKILTLVTCSYNGTYSNERTFAIFRLVERSGEMDASRDWKPTTPRVSGSWK